jgi:hypothetical protein
MTSNKLVHIGDVIRCQRICKNCGKPEFGLFGHWTKTGGYKCDQYDDTGKKLKNTRKSLTV